MHLETEKNTGVEPLCPVFGTCGGCAYQHLPYEEELRVKERRLREVLAGAVSVEEDWFDPIVPSPEPYHSRSRLDLTFLRIKSGDTFLGFMPPYGKRIVEVEACAIARKEISDFIPGLKALAREKLPPKYRNANLVIKTGDDGRVFWGGIGRGSLRMKPADYLWTEVRGRRIFYSLDTFFQANLSILDLLMDRIEALVPENARRLFLDLYSGVGLFGIALADVFERVVMIEENTCSVEVARYNTAHHGLRHVEVLGGKVEDHLKEVLQNADAAPVAMIDPPRKGLSPEALEMIEQARQIRSLFYLSCHPEALARDLRRLLASGWSVRRLVPFDFFPKTVHLETLAFLERT